MTSISPPTYPQYFGAILASVVVFGVYHEAILDFEEKNGNADGDYFLTPKTAGIFAPYPQEFLTHQGGLADQIVSTGWSTTIIWKIGICDLMKEQLTAVCFTVMSKSKIPRFIANIFLMRHYSLQT